MSLYISTSCLKHKLSIGEILNLFRKLGLKNIEIGVWQKYEKDYKRLFKSHNSNFIVHHYFPPPKKPFIINLASQNKQILEKSIGQIKKSIDFCHDFGINLFSFHAGLRVDPDLNYKFNFKNILDYEQSFSIFKNSIMEIVKYAEKRAVKLAIENNVVSESNLIDGKNKLLLMSELWEFERLFKEISSKNLGIVLDLGHLKINSNLLNFDKYNFIKKLKNKVFLVHLHENNGRREQHKKLKKDSWCFKIINKYFSRKSIPLVMESRYSNLKELINNKNLIEKNLKNE